MTEEASERHRKQNRSTASGGNMDQTAMEAQRTKKKSTREELRAERDLTNSFRTPLSLQWNKVCEYCNYTHLSSTTKAQRSICCDNGNQVLAVEKGLEPLPDIVKRIYIDEVEHFSSSSSHYNAMLSLCAMGVDKGTDQGGFENRGAGVSRSLIIRL
jgi:hypothetical protein